MAKLKNGPGKVSNFACSLTLGGCPAKSITHAQAEADVRESTEPAATADVQHGTSGHDYREPEEHNGNGGRYAHCEQGDEEAVQGD